MIGICTLIQNGLYAAYPVVVNFLAGEKNKSGTVRYFCSSCKKTCTASQRKVAQKRSLLHWFERYVLYGNTYETIGSWSGYSIRILEEKFHHFLSESPPGLSFPQLKVDEAYLILDGLWFGKRECLMLYRQSKDKLLIHVSFMKKEYASLIRKDIQTIKKADYHFSGVVSDGGTGVRKAVWKEYPHVPYQICLAHVQRSVRSALGKKPKEYRVQELLLLANHLFLIESKEALVWWKAQVQKWVTQHREFLWERRYDETGRWWFVHKGVRKAVRILFQAYETSFTFLRHPLMPKTTNEIEGSISMLSRKHLIHRGLRRERTKSFITWFIYFYNKDLLSQRKNKED